MKAEHINAFYLATQDVMRMMLDIDIKRGNLRVSDELVPISDANVVIGVTGQLSGSLLYSFPQDMTLEMVKIMAGMEIATIDNFVTSALGEMANIISGNALTHLSQNGYICDIVPPQIIIGSGQILSMATEQAIILPLVTDLGTFDLSISLIEK